MPESTRALRRWLIALLLVVHLHPAAGQMPAIERPSPLPERPRQDDPLGRSTPRGTIAGFIRAVEGGDFVSAARYMQLRENQRADVESLADDLKALMDRYLRLPLTTISESPNGALDDGLALDRERVGPLTIGEKSADIILVRVRDPDAGPIWLISSTTLAQIPALHDSIGGSWIERAMPQALVTRELLGISLAHWVVLGASLLVPFVVLTLLAGAVYALARAILRDPPRRRELDEWYSGTRWPLVTTITLVAQLASMPSLGFPVTFRAVYARVGLVLAVVALTWLLRRLLALGFARARSMIRGRDRASTQSLMVLGERLLNAVVFLVAAFAILHIAGVNTRTALAGVGIGGIALALGAQRTVENLLGGIFLLSDRAIAVGDLCSISNRLGWIEDITLRSVRLRTLEQSLVSIPAGVLAQAGIENFATRYKSLIQGILRLRYGTSVAQLMRILERVREMLDESPRIEKGTARIRLVSFGAEAIELELFAYALTADVPEFLAIREELLLEIAQIAEAEGSGFAPTRFIYMEEGAETAAPISSGTRSDTGSAEETPTGGRRRKGSVSAVTTHGRGARTESAQGERNGDTATQAK